jgi:MT0933-like antitoxin protein
MSEFSDLEKKAKSYAEEHPQTVDKGIDDAARFAEHETGDKHDSEIQRAAEAAERHIGEQEASQGQAGEGQRNQS